MNVLTDRLNWLVDAGILERRPQADDWTRWNDYGIGLFLQGDLKGAQQAFEQITKMDAKNPDGWVNLGRVAVQEGDMDRARQVLEKALQLAQSGDDDADGQHAEIFQQPEVVQIAVIEFSFVVPFDLNADVYSPVRLAAFAEQVQDFADAIRDHRSPAVAPADARAAIELVAAARLSDQTGAAVRLPLDTTLHRSA